ncbi:MAG: IS256 family transposase [Mogibacterium sp.]|nr:IS256 family transposase [Mogibacterium sp.]
MAQLNITLNQDEILQLLCKDRDETFRQLFESSLNTLLEAESAEQLKAHPYERSPERQGLRNGSYDRALTTRIGKITLHVPRHRNQKFTTMIFDNYSRSEASLIACMTEMVINGVSTRKVSRVVEEICGTSFSKSTVSELCKKLDEQVEDFRKRPLTGNYPFVTIDATYFKVREKHRVISKAFMIAFGTNDQGHREILGFGVYHNESKETWNDFLRSLKKRGLNGVLMITSDAHEGIVDAISKVFPSVPWQRCQFHFSKNIADKAPKKYQAGLRGELTELWNCSTIEQAHQKRDEIIRDYCEVAESSIACLDEGFESAITVMALPESLRRYYRTSNHIERLNRELKRRSKVIGIFPNEASLLRLMGSVLIEENASARMVKAIFSPKSYASLLGSDAPLKLLTIAKEQQRLLAA